MKPSTSSSIVKKLDLAYWRAYELRNIFIELSTSLGTPIVNAPRAPEQARESVERLVAWTRGILRVEKVFSSRRVNPEDVLKKWISAIEDLGILVFQLTFEPTDSRAFSLGTKNPPVIVLSYKDADRGRLFSLFHEFAHVVLRQSAICDMSIRSSWAEEIFCNQFAASFLMPKQEVNEVVAKYKDYDLDRIAEIICGQSGASVEASFLRLVSLGHATWEEYNERKPVYEEGYKQWLERKKLSGGPNPNPAGTAFRKHGKHVSRLAHRAFVEGLITRAETASIVRLPARELSKLPKQF